nr:cytochrome p450 71a4 [Quercus suber]
MQFFGPNVVVAPLLLHPFVLSILAFIFFLLFKLSSTLPNNKKTHYLHHQSSQSLKTFPNLACTLTTHPRPSSTPWPPNAASAWKCTDLVVSSFYVAREILKTHDDIFANRPKTRMLRKLSYDFKDVAVAPYDEYWRQMKSILVLHLLSNKRVQSFRAVREEELSLLIEKIKQSCSSSAVNLSEVFAKLTNDIVCRVALGRKFGDGEGGRKLKDLLGELMELLGVINVRDYIPWLAWASRVNGLDAKAEKVIKQFDDFL